MMNMQVRTGQLSGRSVECMKSRTWPSYLTPDLRVRRETVVGLIDFTVVHGLE